MGIDQKLIRFYMGFDYFWLEGIESTGKAFDHPFYFGCTFLVAGHFHEGEDGILGFGQVLFSIISQFNISKICHCLQLPQTSKTFYILFGDSTRLVSLVAPLI